MEMNAVEMHAKWPYECNFSRSNDDCDRYENKSESQNIFISQKKKEEKYKRNLKHCIERQTHKTTTVGFCQFDFVSRSIYESNWIFASQKIAN